MTNNPKTSTKRIIERKYRSDIRRLASYWPVEQITLMQAHDGKISIRLQNGEIHDFSPEEINILLEQVPRFLWKLFSIPIMLRYENIGGERFYRVLGDIWQRRLVEIMLTGNYTYKGKETLTISEFSIIIRRFKSLIFVSLSI